MDKNYEIREMKQKGYCRVCNKEIERKSEKVVTFYNEVRQGGYDYICLDCIKQIYNDIK